MQTLVIVDFQRDFYEFDGSLYVKDGETILGNVIDYIFRHHDEISDVVFTIDWHPIDHCSFKDNGGTWPSHCVQYTEGAGIPDTLIDAVHRFNIPFKFFIKGNNKDHEEYGAFDSIGTYYVHDTKALVTVNNISRNCHTLFDSNNVVVCGIAGDYCVMNTIKNLKKYNGPVDLDVSLFVDGVCSIDGTNETIKTYCKENNVKLI